MTIDTLRAYCLSFPKATENLQWGDDLCFKVDGKLFVIATLDLDHAPRLSLKCDAETFAAMMEREGVAPAPYVGRYHWIGVEDLDTFPQRELEDLIARSYELVVAKLPKKRARKVGRSKRRTAKKSKAKAHRRRS